MSRSNPPIFDRRSVPKDAKELIWTAPDGWEIRQFEWLQSGENARGSVLFMTGRADFYEKELSFQVSCSYGPGRYDEDYEQKGQDYPLPYVRWTENRNFQAILEAISTGKLQVKDLITEVVDLEDYQKIYGSIGDSKSIASLLRYPSSPAERTATTLSIGDTTYQGQSGVLGIIGAGGIGQVMFETIRGFYYSDAAAILIIVIVTVTLMDLVSQKLRKMVI